MEAIWTWIMAHQVLMAGMGVALMDFIFAMVPALQGNGLLHWVYGLLVGLKTPPAA